MTDGHEHWLVEVKPNGLLHRALTKPIWWSTNLDKVDKSPYPWGPCLDCEEDECWYLSPLSILHRWFGLTLWLPDE